MERMGVLPETFFLQKMKAVTGSMAHTVEATRKARKNMYALITYFGLPALMLTVTPIELFCF
jgi:hypothetical protein